MYRLNGWTVYINTERIYAEKFGGDVHSNHIANKKIKNVQKISQEHIAIDFKRGKGKITFKESATGNYFVEIYLPRFLIGVIRLSGSITTAQYHSIHKELGLKSVT